MFILSKWFTVVIWDCMPLHPVFGCLPTIWCSFSLYVITLIHNSPGCMYTEI